jgi:alpha-tubulin suppressor-like RCC1 family protein
MRRGLVALAVSIAVLSGVAAADQASQPTSLAAGSIATGSFHNCAVLSSGMRCWGYGGDGQLGYASKNTLGDDERPGSVGPVDLGPGRGVKAMSADGVHSCAVLDDDTVRCWGFGGDGRLGYANTVTIGDDEPPGSVGPVDLGPGRTAKAISAGGGHTCAIVDDGSVRCWGFGGDGRLGYANRNSVGDDETPGSIGPVDLGPGRTAKAISAGGNHTCALLDDDDVRCWGFGTNGQLGYPNTVLTDATTNTIGDDETPGSIGPVDLGPGRTAKAISAGSGHTCAIVDDDSVRCWGFGGNGRLGYASTNTVGDDETPGSAGPVDLGPGRRAKAISAGENHTCAVLDDDSVRCWGFGNDGRLGYANTNDVGDNETPGSIGPVDLGPGRKAKAISAGSLNTCALLDDDTVRCWGSAANGRLGSCSSNAVGDDETPGSVGPIALQAPGPPCPTNLGAVSIPPSGGGPPAPPTPTPSPGPSRASRPRDPLAAEALRARALRTCLTRARRQAKSKRARARAACRRRHGRTPGRVTRPTARALKTRIVLGFAAPGSDGARPPAARAYLIKQSRKPIRSRRDFARAKTLCKGSCRFKITRVGTRTTLTVTGLRPGTTYYYAIAARDNVSGRPGPRSTTVRATTRPRS